MDDKETAPNLEKSVNPPSGRQFQRQVEQEYREEVRRLGNESHQRSLEIRRLEEKINKVQADFDHYKESNIRALEAAKSLAEATSTGKKAMTIIATIVILIGGIASSYEHLKRWMLEK